MKKILSLVAVVAMVVTLVSVAAFSASAATTKVYKFTFESPNASTILKKNGEYVGEVVEWPEGSGNHCLRYQLGPDTRNQENAGGAHAYIWPVGLGGALAAQGDLDDTGSEIQMKVEFANSGSVQGSYMYPFILFNDEEENYADHSVYAPGQNKFKQGTFNWSRYEVGAPVNGLGNGGVSFCDELTLSEGTYMYVDNIEFDWIGTWTDVSGLFIGYPDGTPCEESDLTMGTMETDPAQPSESDPTPSESQQNPSESTPSESQVDPTASQPTGLAGDANGDGSVNMKDVLAIRKYVAGIAGELDLAASDMNGDGSVNMKDVLAVRKVIAGIA